MASFASSSSQSIYISGFHKIIPPHKVPQETMMENISNIHIEAEKKNKGLTPEEVESFREQFKESLSKVAVGLGPKHIRYRYTFVDDFAENAEKKLIYDTNEHEGEASSTSVRSQEFLRIAENIVNELYENVHTPPENIIHTTCTGYFFPNAVQRLILKKGWTQDTMSINAYHMGCHAAIPTVRMADGFARSGRGSVDCVHTEICLLHVKSLDQTLSRMVIDNLFADGAIKYTVSSSNFAPKPAAGFELLSTQEFLVPNSLDQMSWIVADNGFDMNLSKDVALHVVPFIQDMIERLKSKANVPADEDLSKAIFAIHPGGPTIVSQIAEHLKLEFFQYRYSVMILAARGNMSSATIPHIWELIMNDNNVAPGTLIFSMAFGPGLTIAGALLRKL